MMIVVAFICFINTTHTGRTVLSLVNRLNKTLSLSIISRSGGLKESAVAGKPSVTKLTQRSWTGIRASGTPNAAAKKIDTTSPMLEL